jgi:hypothetical protein
MTSKQFVDYLMMLWQWMSLEECLGEYIVFVVDILPFLEDSSKDWNNLKSFQKAPSVYFFSVNHCEINDQITNFSC